MKLSAFLFAVSTAAALSAQPNADSDQLAAINRQADALLASSDLDRAEPLLQQALDIAARLGSNHEAAAQIRIFDLYVQLAKHDSLSWTHIGLPYLLKALDFAKAHPAESASRLGAQYALAVMQFTPHELKPAAASLFFPFLKESIAGIESKAGPLHPETAVAYEALATFPDGSAAQLQALNACELLTQLDPAKIAPAFAPVLSLCADARLRAGIAADAIRYARMARLAAAADKRHGAYEIVLSNVVESEAEFALGHFDRSLAAIDSGVTTARAELARQHSLWKRILEIRATALAKLQNNESAARAKRDLNEWSKRHESSKVENRIQTPRALRRLPPSLTAAASTNGYGEASFAALCLIAADGSVKVLVRYTEPPYGLTAAGTKALESWKFRPYMLDGKPVAGITTLQTLFSR